LGRSCYWNGLRNLNDRKMPDRLPVHREIRMFELTKQDVRHLAIDTYTKMDLIFKWWDYQTGTEMNNNLRDTCSYIREFIEALDRD